MTKQTEADQAAVKLAQQLLQIAHDLESAQCHERVSLIARIRRQEFLALLAAGFSEQQALFFG